MIARLAIALLAASAVSRALCADTAFEVEPYLDATREIEDWQGRDGRHGERGAYGIREAAWRQHMGDMPFAAARQERWSRECARRHVAWLRRELARGGVHPGVFNVALAYNAGLARVLSGRVPERAYDYALRVRAIYSKSVHLSNLARHRLRLDDRPLALWPDESIDRIVGAFIETGGLPAKEPAGLNETLGSVLGEALTECGDLGRVAHASSSITAVSRGAPTGHQSGSISD